MDILNKVCKAALMTPEEGCGSCAGWAEVTTSAFLDRLWSPRGLDLVNSHGTWVVAFPVFKPLGVLRGDRDKYMRTEAVSNPSCFFCRHSLLDRWSGGQSEHSRRQ